MAAFEIAAPPGITKQDLFDDRPRLLQRAARAMRQAADQPLVRHIGVAGLGPLGLGLAAVLRYAGRHSVIGWDAHPEMVGKHAMDSGLSALLNEGVIPMAPSLGHLINHADLVFLTPETGRFLGGTRWYLQEVVGEILDLARDRRDRPLLLINSCPVRPGTTKDLILWGQRLPHVDLGYHPIRATPTQLSDDLQNPDSLFLGADTRMMLQAFEQMWRPIVNTVPVHYVTVGEAEVLGHYYYRINGWQVDE